MFSWHLPNLFIVRFYSSAGSFVCLSLLQFLLIHDMSRLFSSGKLLDIFPDHRITAAEAAAGDTADMRAEQKFAIVSSGQESTG